MVVTMHPRGEVKSLRIRGAAGEVMARLFFVGNVVPVSDALAARVEARAFYLTMRNGLRTYTP
ncbi:MAG: hypothetical protein GYA24_20325 [Candidatus Lokiarchaeota archaeon]|nr:hypothetical protein [Candidatus Lokiarchaeota archaeon]